MNLVGYLRVSTIGQANDGFGLDSQRTAITQWAEANGHRVIRWCEDAAVSGTTEAADRPGFGVALSYLEDRTVVGFVAYDMTRIARDLMVQEVALALLWKHTKHVFTTASGPVLPDDNSDPTRTLIRQILGALSQFERMQIAARMQRGKAEAAKRGKHVNGRYHYGRHPDRPREVEWLRFMVEQHAEGKSYREIAYQLNLREAPTRIEGSKWHPTTVRNILLTQQNRKRKVKS